MFLFKVLISYNEVICMVSGIFGEGSGLGLFFEFEFVILYVV